MDIDDLLTFAAGTWRGKPLPFRHDLLGEVGSRYRAAFEATWPAPGTDLSLAFEYFTGLIFNADYADPDGFVSLVASWLVEPSVYWLLQVDGGYRRKPLNRWYDVSFTTAMVVDPVGPPSRPWLVSEGGAGDWGIYSTPYGEPDVVRYTLTLYNGQSIIPASPDPNRPVAEGRYEEHSYLTDIIATLSPPTQEDDEGVSAFKPVVLSAVLDYAASEKQQDRDFPAPAATSAAENGYLFPNWANELYGSPVAR